LNFDFKFETYVGGGLRGGRVQNSAIHWMNQAYPKLFQPIQDPPGGTQNRGENGFISTISL
jgi:hypothetical protein